MSAFDPTNIELAGWKNNKEVLRQLVEEFANDFEAGKRKYKNIIRCTIKVSNVWFGVEKGNCKQR